MSPFDELVIANHTIEFGIVDKMIVNVIRLARPLGTGRGRDRHGDIAVRFHQHPGDGRLPRARWRREHDEKAAAATGRVVGVV